MDVLIKSKKSVAFVFHRKYKQADFTASSAVSVFGCDGFLLENIALNIFTRIGGWVEKHFPERMTTADVKNMMTARFNVLDGSLEDVLGELSLMRDRLKKIESELESFKTQSIVKTRIIGQNPSAMTPFASRLQPVQPANGGNASPQ